LSFDAVQFGAKLYSVDLIAGDNSSPCFEAAYDALTPGTNFFAEALDFDLAFSPNLDWVGHCCACGDRVLLFDRPA